MAKKNKGITGGKKVTRYTHENIKEIQEPETGHTALILITAVLYRDPSSKRWTAQLAYSGLTQFSADGYDLHFLWTETGGISLAFASRY